MELTGGEPDVVGHDKKTGKFVFMDCAPESPAGQRSVCYDRAGLESRKEHRPQTTAMDLAAVSTILSQKEHDLICLTDIAWFKSVDRFDDLIRN